MILKAGENRGLKIEIRGGSRKAEGAAEDDMIGSVPSVRSVLSWSFGGSAGGSSGFTSLGWFKYLVAMVGCTAFITAHDVKFEPYLFRACITPGRWNAGLPANLVSP